MKQMDELTSVRKRYDRFSRVYDIFEKPMEMSFFRMWRKDLISNLRGNILEIGVGTGKNLEFYRKDANVIGIDLSKRMLKEAEKKLKRLQNKNITLLEMDAQNLKFKNNYFDYVLCTCVLCSVPDPLLVLKEMKRVVKKNGKILMIEHMLSRHWPIALFENVFNPLTKRMFGFNINRDTKKSIHMAGLKIEKETNLFLDVFRRIEIKGE